ncbi:MAG: DNA-directed RNA polymerase subunit G [Pyrodictiaceae archaeon]
MARRKAIVEFTGKVKDVERELIPRLYKAHIVSARGDYEVYMDLHEDLVMYNVGDKLLVGLYRDLPSYVNGVDLVMRARLVSRKESEGSYTYLFSAGGLLFMLTSKRRELELEPLQLVYIKVSRKEG